MAAAALQELLHNVHLLLQETTRLWKMSSFHLGTAPKPPGWGLAVLYLWILALRSWLALPSREHWLPVPDREQRMSSERVAMRTLQAWAVS